MPGMSKKYDNEVDIVQNEELIPKEKYEVEQIINK